MERSGASGIGMEQATTTVRSFSPDGVLSLCRHGGRRGRNDSQEPAASPVPAPSDADGDAVERKVRYRNP